LNAEIANKPLTKSERLSDGERTRKELLEGRIARTLKAATECWTALEEILSRRLYREDYADAETYCREKWGMSSGYSRRLATASVTASHIIEHSQTQNVTALIT